MIISMSKLRRRQNKINKTPKYHSLSLLPSLLLLLLHLPSSTPNTTTNSSCHRRKPPATATAGSHQRPPPSAPPLSHGLKLFAFSIIFSTLCEQSLTQFNFVCF